jgi:alpha-L-fucosidase 2
VKTCQTPTWIQFAAVALFGLCAGTIFPLFGADQHFKFELPASKNSNDAASITLWYRKPAETWLDALPLGNGYMGAMVFGRLQEERIALNESSFWSGRPHDYNDTNAFQYFAKIKDLVFDGKFQEAEKIADDHFWGIPKAQQAYEPIGDLLLRFDGAEYAMDYRRELDMETGVAKLDYRVGDVTFTREIFMSYPERVMVIRLSSDKPARVSVQARFKSPFLDTITATTNRLVMDGFWRKPVNQTNWLVAPVEGPGLKFETAMIAMPEGGILQTMKDGLRIEKANSVTFILTTATSYLNFTNITANPAAICQEILSHSASEDYALLRRHHENDFRGLMGRVHLNVGDPTANGKPTDERLAAVRAGMPDPNLEALVFQFGRYILAASSRAGGQPANLQGIWNENVLPPWGSKYTININTEMNYWLAEVCNLSECTQPLFYMLKDISITGAKTAKDYYNAGGWVAHHNIDLWRGTAPVDAARFGMWPVGGTWLCQHIWEHYAFTGDQNFLRQYYPVMKGAAQFLLEVLVEEPKHHWLVTPFSMSPEHGYLDGEGKISFLSPSPTMDVGLIRELFPHCIEASRTLNLDADFRQKLEAALKKIPPYQIGKSGFVQEWIDDWQPGPQGHNVSPNFPFYPGSSITLRGNPEFAVAYQRWMEAHNPRGGFPLSWGIAMWARLERGDKVGELIQSYMKRGPANNLHNGGSNQSDASFGFTAAVAEALLQSHAGEINLLPALPPQWPNGSVRGLRARGGYEVNIEWKDGKITFAEVSNRTNASTIVRYAGKTAMLDIRAGETARLNAELAAMN